MTSRVLEDHRAGRLSEAQIVAVLAHELGHHATGAASPMLIAMWLAGPWRLVARLVTGLAGALSGRPCQRTMRLMLFVGVTVAVVRAVYQDDWMVGGGLAALALSAVICPLADAAVSRRAEFAADRFAADHGLARELAAALRALDVTSSSASGWSRRLLASHPAPEQRISALLAVRVGVGATDQLRSGAGTRRPAAA